MTDPNQLPAPLGPIVAAHQILDDLLGDPRWTCRQEPEGLTLAAGDNHRCVVFGDHNIHRCGTPHGGKRCTFEWPAQ